MKTKAFVEKFGKGVVFAVWEVDEDGNKKGEYPIVSLGRKKLSVLKEYQEEIEKFLTEVEK